jgi:uncharacterized protein (TIGR02147 family)
MKIALIAGRDASISPCDIPSLLRERLRAAKRRNQRFSLRAFAKQLGVDHSTLSQVLRNRRRLSARALETIGKHLGLGDEAIRVYAENYRRKASSYRPRRKLRSRQLDLDTFQFLSAWHHCAILELVAVRGFKTDVRWIGEVLGIGTDDVNIAVQRLLRLGLLQMSTRKLWIDKAGDTEFYSSGLTEAARNQMSQEIHQLAIRATRRIPSEYRVDRQMVVAIASAKVPRLKMMVDEFLSEVSALLTESGTKEDVYQLEISFSPLTKLTNSGGNKNG